MNAIIKVSGVSSAGIARLMSVIESDAMKVIAASKHASVCTVEPEPNTVYPDNTFPVEKFRFVQLVEVKPENNSETYLLTLRIFFCVWVGSDHQVERIGRDAVLQVFRALDERNLPSPDNREKIKQIFGLLKRLVTHSCPLEVYDYKKESVVLNKGANVTFEKLVTEIFPILKDVLIHGKVESDCAFAINLWETKRIAESMD